jgi:predicted nucleic acid-binding protein
VIVIDASVLVKFILKEEGWNKIADFLKAGTISVDLVIKETVNAIWKRVMRKEISLEETKSMFEAMKEILNKAVIIENEMDYIDEAFEISIKQNITVYDSLYIALAKKKKLELLTADEIQAQAATLEGVRAIVLQ